MRLSLIRYAEILARKIVLESGKDVEYIDIADMAETFLEEQKLLQPVDKDDFEVFIEYVDYLVTNAEITVTLPKERL